MSKKFGFLFILIGVVLMLSALLLFVNNKLDDNEARLESEFYLDNLKDMLAANTGIVSSEVPVTDSGESVSEGDVILPPADDMPISNINGYDFIGYVSIPSIKIELPVLADWDYNKLDIAPCRQAGSIVTDDLVIAAHNYVSHFANFEYLEIGAKVDFTTMNNSVVNYTVTGKKILGGTAVEDVLNSGHDLVLYTCTFEGTTRIVVFCDRT